MPTGYTEGIIDGDIKSFKEFAKLCIRNFGATIHMRDDSLYNEYVPRTPSDYHLIQIKDSEDEIKKIEASSDIEIIETYKKNLEDRKNRLIEKIAKCKIVKSKLIVFLIKAQEFKPPTPDHEDYKKFMIEQLRSTLERDGDSKYYENELLKNEKYLKNIDVNKIRKESIEIAKNRIAYHLKEYNSEIIRCEESNRWVSSVFNALENIK